MADNNKSHEETSKGVSIICIGGCGTGKSTMGNFFLEGQAQGPFMTYEGVDSCTKTTTTCTVSGRTFTDTPGIPDTDPTKTKDYYNECINALKLEHSAILFVFKMERIDPAKFSRARLLFREMRNSICPKFLVINDHNDYFLNDPPAPEEYRSMTQEIRKYTQVDFVGDIIMTTETIGTTMNGLGTFFQAVQARPSPSLRTFDELGTWVDSLKSDIDYRNAIVQEQENARRRHRNDLIAFNAAFATSAAAGFAGFVVFSIVTSGAGAAPGFRAGMDFINAGYKQIENRRSDLNLIKGDIEKENDELAKAIEELKVATNEFGELRDAVVHFS